MYTLAFNINETLKLVYAQSALRALASSAEQKHPHIFDDDNEALLHVIFVNGFFTLAQAMMGYVIGYELDIDRIIRRISRHNAEMAKRVKEIALYRRTLNCSVPYSLYLV